MTAAVVVAGLVALAAIAALVYFIRETARERSVLLDRVQAPQAAQLAAVQRAIDERPPASDEADDKTYGYDIRPSDDLALVDLIPRSE